MIEFQFDGCRWVFSAVVLIFFPALYVASMPCAQQHLREIYLVVLPPDLMTKGRVEDVLLKHVGEGVTAFLSILRWMYLKHSLVSTKNHWCPIEES